jgi:hypothetical protein
MMTTRNFKVHHRGVPFEVMVEYDATGRPDRISISGDEVSPSYKGALHIAGVALALSLQHGVSLGDIRDKLAANGSGSVLYTVVNRLLRLSAH